MTTYHDNNEQKLMIITYNNEQKLMIIMVVGQTYYLAICKRQF